MLRLRRQLKTTTRYDRPGRIGAVERIRFNAEGFISPKGKVKGWRFDSVRVILENPAYTGDYASGRYAGGGKYLTTKQGNVVPVTAEDRGQRRPAVEWTLRPDRHEAIIDRPTFERAQEILAKGKTGPSPHTPETNPYLLTGVLSCGKCGAPLRGLVTGKRRFYECGNRNYNGNDACQGTTVREDVVLLSIADHRQEEFLSLDNRELYSKAERGELEPGDLPKAFFKVRQLVAPPKQQANDRKKLEKEHKTLGEQIVTARRNLGLLTDPSNIPALEADICQ